VRRNLIGLGLALTVLALLALLAWTFLEIGPTARWVPPSREARANEYLALDRWLEEMGHPVRTLDFGNLDTISTAEERQIFLQSSLFRWWTPEAVEYLIRWIEEGGTLFLVLDYAEWDIWIGRQLSALFEEFGITANAGTTLQWSRNDPYAPSFGQDFSFEVSQEPAAGDLFTLEDWNGVIRLVKAERGMGRLIVSGRPRFLLSTELGNAPNAHLTWTLFLSNATTADKPGWLFIRGTTRAQGLLGTLFRHGNLVVVGVAALALLVVGLWAVIPMFGLVRRDNEKPGKPLRERFIAEGRFLKRYGALGFYRDVYIRDIRRRLARKEGLSTDDEITARVLSILGKTGGERESRIFVSAIRKEPVKYWEFPKMISIFKTILERI